MLSCHENGHYNIKMCILSDHTVDTIQQLVIRKKNRNRGQYNSFFYLMFSSESKSLDQNLRLTYFPSRYHHITCISSCFYIISPFQVSQPILIILISKAFEKTQRTIYLWHYQAEVVILKAFRVVYIRFHKCVLFHNTQHMCRYILLLK